MKIKDIIISLSCTILPMLLLEVIKKGLQGSVPPIVIYMITAMISFIILYFLYFILNILLKRCMRYCGNWIEELTDTESKEKLIGIGNIRFDMLTNEYVFIGTTYDTSGNELYNWSIDFLRKYKDNAMQYICGMQIPNIFSNGQIVFLNRNEFKGTIWTMEGKTFTLHSSRITTLLLDELGIKDGQFRLHRSSQQLYPQLAHQFYKMNAKEKL